MKKLYFISAVTLLMLLGPVYTAFSQAPEGFYYQAEARDSRGRLFVNTTLTVQAGILFNSPNGDPVWEEKYKVTTDKYGLFSIIIGEIEGEEIFSNIDWGNGKYYLSMKILYGSSTIQMPVTQLISVPYALYAKSAGSTAITETDPVFTDSQAANISVTDITNLNNLSGINTGDQDLSGKVDKVEGKGLSTEDFTTVEKTKLSGIADEANNYVHPTGDGNLHVPETTSTNNGKVLTAGATVGSLSWTTPASGTITNVTGMSPIISSGGPAPVISITAATATATGSMSATDKTKLDAISGTNTGDQNLASVLTMNNSANSQTITDLANPVNDQDAATKAYVDELKLKISALEDWLILAGLSTVSDVDGNSYKVVKIGDQFWMAENLKTTKYYDGTVIPLVTDATAWFNLTTPGYCWYNNDQATNGSTYGAVYNWYAVSTGKLCPTGWHVPSNEEWTTLTTLLGGVLVAGGKMKETGTTHWISPNTGATNESGFSGLPGGYRSLTGIFELIGRYGYWWSSTEYDTTHAFCRWLDYDTSNPYWDFRFMGSGYSVRCVKDN